MVMKRAFLFMAVISLTICSSLAYGQYEDVPELYIEGYVGPNLTVPLGYMSNDLMTIDSVSLNAEAGFGLDAGVGYFFKSTLVGGLYFNARNMGVEDLDLHHRVFEFGVYGKFYFSNIEEGSFSPYVRLNAGLNFSKLVTRVEREGVVAYRELSHDPTLGTGISVGVFAKTNSYGGLYLEGTFNFDLMDGVGGDYKDQVYEWGDNNQYFVVKAGVVFNIGPSE